MRPNCPQHHRIPVGLSARRVTSFQYLPVGLALDEQSRAALAASGPKTVAMIQARRNALRRLTAVGVTRVDATEVLPAAGAGSDHRPTG